MARSEKHDSVSYVPINRSLFQHFLWKEKRTFSKCEAWLDLIQSARFEQSQAKELVGGKLMTWERGQLPASVRFLSSRWKWSKHKVEDFLKLLETESMIKCDASGGQTIISLLNYGFHNASGQQKGHVKPPPQSVSSDSGDSKGDKRGTSRGQPGDETNKDNKENKEETIHGVPPVSDSALELFKNFQEWLLKWAPNVARMKEPFTAKQYDFLRDKYKPEALRKILLAMHNWKPLLTKNNSAYLTVINWIERREIE